MKSLVSLCRHLLTRRIPKGLFVSAAVYALYLAYVGLNLVLVSKGAQDPVFRFTGIPRTEQVVIVSIAFGCVFVPLLIQHLARDGLALNFASSSAMKRGTLLLVALLFLNSLAASLAVVLNELSSQFWTPLFVWIFAVLALQVLIVYAALSRIGQSWLHLGLMAALSGLNFFALYLSLLEQFLSLSDIFRAAVIAAVLLLFALLFAVVGKGIVPVRNVNTVLVLTILGPVAGIVFASPEGSATQQRMAAFDDIDFRAKPNIHIVSIDALTPATLAKKHMGLVDLPYSRLLDSDGVLVFKNAFASHVTTKPSLNSLMRLAHIDFDDNAGYFAGRTDGPVTHILRSNGYKISTGFDRHFFGSKGPFVDSYVPKSELSVVNSSLCALATGNSYKFFSFCTLASLLEDPEPRQPWPDRVLDIIRLSNDAPDTIPEFTLHYIFDSIHHHTELDFRSSDRQALARYAASYYRGAARFTQIMERLQAMVRDDPAPSILIVMGDHGPMVSRTVSVENNLTFVVQDRHGILAAILVNDTGCTTQQLQHYTKAFATPERILAGVIRCLARDPARVDAAMKFDEAFEFQNFLYE